MVSTLLESTIDRNKDSETDREQGREAERWLQHTYIYTQIPGNNNSYFLTHDCMIISHSFNTKWSGLEKNTPTCKATIIHINKQFLSFSLCKKQEQLLGNVRFCYCFLLYKQSEIYKKQVYILLIFVLEPF